MSPFEVVQAIQSAGVGVVGLDLRRTVVVLRSVEHQDIGETVVIRFRCVSPPNRNIRRVPRVETETPPSDFLRGRTYPYWRWMYGACLPRGPVTRRTYKQSWISTAAAPPPPPGSWIWNPKPRNGGDYVPTSSRKKHRTTCRPIEQSEWKTLTQTKLIR